MKHGWSKPTKIILSTFTSDWFRGGRVTQSGQWESGRRLLGVGRLSWMTTPWLKEIGKETCPFFLSRVQLSKDIMTEVVEGILWQWGNKPEDKKSIILRLMRWKDREGWGPQWHPWTISLSCRTTLGLPTTRHMDAIKCLYCFGLCVCCLCQMFSFLSRSFLTTSPSSSLPQVASDCVWPLGSPGKSPKRRRIVTLGLSILLALHLKGYLGLAKGFCRGGLFSMALSSPGSSNFSLPSSLWGFEWWQLHWCQSWVTSLHPCGLSTSPPYLCN